MANIAKTCAVIAALVLAGTSSWAQRSETLLEKGWKFHLGDEACAEQPCFDDSSWEEVRVPHDWAIKGPFDRRHDLQEVAVTQNFETEASVKTGRTGGLPYIGCGWYRTSFASPRSGRSILVFDGAMSEARIYVNGKEAIFWPYGYNSFHCDVTGLLNAQGEENVLAVRLENRPFSSRWYPGAGLYRNVHLLNVNDVHVPVWGSHVTTPHIESGYATVRIDTRVENPQEKRIRIETDIIAPDGSLAASQTFSGKTGKGQPLTQNFIVENPLLWSPESPSLYIAQSRIWADDVLCDSYETSFGIRSMEFIPHKGFFLNGEPRKFRGVCNHHDLGALGAAVNEAALRRQITLLKDMGCDAIRTSHNMPAPELVRLCDEMGMMMMIEPFDEWDIAKCENGYHRFFEEWAEKDMVNMLRQFRNHPCVAIWSIGNEVPTQCSAQGYQVASFLRDICHREDPTRPVTCGMDQVSCVLENGFAQVVDIPGLNYRTFRYLEAYEDLPHGFVLGSETASTVSSRGVYKFPAQKEFGKIHDDNQCSSYDEEACWWSNVPDIDFALADDYPWTLGQFVWTGFDYLGEPSPYDTDAWPSHSSMFGIIDLATIPKDRFYLYRSIWNSDSPTLHLLPHWNWEEGQNVPVYVYTSYPEAEVFVNGVSQGRLRKAEAAEKTLGGQQEELEPRYRLMWKDVIFHKGELKVVAYDEDGNAADTRTVRTAGKPHHIVLEADRNELKADGKDLVYVKASIVDKNGNLCPDASRELDFKVSGAASFEAAANGDPTCLDAFQDPHMHCFSGQLMVILRASETPGEAALSVSGKGLVSETIKISIL